MGRSVSYPRNAVVAFRRFDVYDEDGNVMEEPDEDQVCWAWDDLVEDVRTHSKTLWPSLSDCDVWVGREDHALLQNDHAYVGVSEYCGLVAVWVVPRTDIEHEALAANWCGQIANRFKATWGEYVKVATFSNGEAVYQKAA